MIRRHKGGFTWDGVDILPYKEDGTIFKSVTRQRLFDGGHDLPVELRYFEVGDGGHSTLERHQHAHLVMVVKGKGQVLVGDKISDIELQDVVQIAPMTWHQFRASRGEELGFLCVVSVDRDKAQRPGEAELQEIKGSPEVAEFVRV
ncbi:MAG: cupin domain-containing protein [Fimbriimonas sp.]